jgi:hypothetical protein
MGQAFPKDWTPPTVRDWLHQITFNELAGATEFVDGRRVPADVIYMQNACPNGLHPALSTDPALPVLAEWIRSEYGGTVSEPSIAMMLTTLRARTGLTLDEVWALHLADAVRALGLKMPDGAWKASPPVSEPHADKPTSTPGKPVRQQNDHDPTNGKDTPTTLVAWLKRVTPEWPPMGIDWPLVLGTDKCILSAAHGVGNKDWEGQEAARSWWTTFETAWEANRSRPRTRCPAGLRTQYSSWKPTDHWKHFAPPPSWLAITWTPSSSL